MLVKSLENLKELIDDNGDYVEFYILLAGGLMSSKRIMYLPEHDYVSIIHEVDDSEQELTFSEIATKTNLLEAINKFALFKYPD
ncbi:MAG: hypothetical protein AB8G11_22960 [Saprospiraceae bacterium]